jgi:flagellar hook-basal body complex protein FliE
MEPISMDGLLAKLQAARAIASGLPAPASPTGTNQVDFAALMKGAIDKVDQTQGSAARMAEQFQLGDPKVTLEDTMVALQKANVSFQAALQIRNRVVSAYHDIMNLQI